MAQNKKPTLNKNPMFVVVVLENQRWQPFRGFGNSNPGHMMPHDPLAWSMVHAPLLERNGSKVRDGQEMLFEPVVANDVLLDGDTIWEVVIDENTDKDGWEYAVDFTHAYGMQARFGPRKTFFSTVRRRKWVRSQHSPDVDGVTSDADEEVDAVFRCSPRAGSLFDSFRKPRSPPHEKLQKQLSSREIAEAISSTSPAKQVRSLSPTASPYSSCASSPVRDRTKSTCDTEEGAYVRRKAEDATKAMWAQVHMDGWELQKRVESPLLIQTSQEKEAGWGGAVRVWNRKGGVCGKMWMSEAKIPFSAESVMAVIRQCEAW